MKLVGTDLWQLEGPAIRMPGGVMMPLASAVVRLADRSLLLYSPIRIDDAQAKEIEAQGEVAHIVAPNLLHHLHLEHACERWPRAILHGAPGLAAKRHDLRFDHELVSGRLDANLDVEVIGGAPKANEVVMFHRPSGTLVCADFLFNVTRPANLRTRLVLAFMGVGGGELKQSRLWRMLAKDRAAVRASIDRVLAWPIRIVLPVHGEPVAIDAAALAPKLSRAYGRRVTALLPA